MKDRVLREHDAEGAWTNEALPLSIRRDILNRELNKVLADRSGPEANASSRDSAEESSSSENSSHGS